MEFSKNTHTIKRPNYTGKILIVAGTGMLLSIADLVTTRLIIEKGGFELNPLMAAIIQSDTAFFILRGMALLMICLSLWMLQYENPARKKSLKSYFPYIAFLVISPWIIAVLWNLGMLWRMQ